VDAETTAIDYGVGNRSRQPDFEGRVGVNVKVVPGIDGTVGLGYHTGWRRYFFTTDHRDKRATLVGLDLDTNLTQYLQFKGEWFQAKGTDDFMNGMVSPSALSPSPAGLFLSRTSGWWIQAVLKATPELWVVAGHGIEKADKDGVATTGANSRYQNEETHAGLIANAGKNLRLGLEVAQTTSSYQDTTVAAAGNATSGSPKATQISLSAQVPF
jgi:hypothetical protein